jgi:hypothetical protein
VKIFVLLTGSIAGSGTFGLVSGMISNENALHLQDK